MSFNFQNVNDMLPSELASYVKDLENEVGRQEELLKKADTPDTYIARGNQEFKSEEELLADLEIGEVVEALSFKRHGQSFRVKISDSRIDDYPTRIEAEHAAMLHGVKV